MTEYSVMYSHAAKNDIIQIYEYIAYTLLSEPTAKKYTVRIRNSIRSLKIMPLRNPQSKNKLWKGLDLRKMLVENFIVYYSVNKAEKTVIVMRIIYGGRDINSLK